MLASGFFRGWYFERVFDLQTFLGYPGPKIGNVRGVLTMRTCRHKLVESS